MKRRASRRTQKKYDPSETFSTKDILMAIRLSLGKEPPKRKITLGLPLTKVTARASLNVQHSEKKVTTIKRVSNKSTMQKKNIVIKRKDTGKDTNKIIKCNNNNNNNNNINDSSNKRKRKIRRTTATTDTSNSRHNKLKQKKTQSDMQKVAKKQKVVKKNNVNNKNPLLLATPDSKKKNKLGHNLLSSISSSNTGRGGRLNIDSIDKGMEEGRYKGMTKLKTGTGRYRASLSSDGNKYNLGDYDSLIGAACSYDKAGINIVNDVEDGNDYISLNFDWFMPKTNFHDRKVIRDEYIRMITKKKARSSYARSKSPVVDPSSKQTSMKKFTNNSRRSFVDDETHNVEARKMIKRMQEEDLIKREKERNELEELQRKNWWFNTYKDDKSFDDVELEVNNFLSRPM